MAAGGADLPGLQRHFERDLFAVAFDADLDRITRLVSGKQDHPFLDGCDLLAIPANEDIAVLNARQISRSAFGHCRNTDPHAIFLVGRRLNTESDLHRPAARPRICGRLIASAGRQCRSFLAGRDVKRDVVEELNRAGAAEAVELPLNIVRGVIVRVEIGDDPRRAPAHRGD